MPTCVGCKTKYHYYQEVDGYCPSCAKSMAVAAKISQEIKDGLWFGKSCTVPREVATCPECNGTLSVECNSWDSVTGQPHEIDMDCENESFYEDDEAEGKVVHRYFQSDWQPVRDAIDKWCGCERIY